MKLIIGLGNPGKQYEKTRHNAGFIMMDKFKEECNFPDFEFNKKFNADVSVGNNTYCSLPGEEKIILIKPQTFMNLSGESVRSVLDFYKLSPEDIIVIHDDIDLPLGKYKTTESSGSAGHNGVQDIFDKVGTKNIKRIRIGVATENLRTQTDPSDFVLQKFQEDEMKTIEDLSEKILEEIKNSI